MSIQKKFLPSIANIGTELQEQSVIGQIPDKVTMCQVKYVICPDINEQVNPGSKIWLPNVWSILKPYCGPWDWERLNGSNGIIIIMKSLFADSARLKALRVGAHHMAAGCVQNQVSL